MRKLWALSCAVSVVLGLTVGVAPGAAAATGVPVTASAVVAGLNVNVDWTVDSAAGVTGYEVTTIPESPVVLAPAGSTSAVLTGVRPNKDYRVFVAPIGAGGAGTPVEASNTVHVKAPGGSFTAVAPARFLDTRTGIGAPAGATRAVTLQVTGRGAVPSSDVSAVALNVTVTAPATAGYLTAYPAGSSRPVVSSLNYVRAQTVANLVIVPVSANGRVSLYSFAKAHLIVDVAGYFSTAAAANPTGGLFHPLQPARLMDTRSGFGASTPGPGEQVRIKVLGSGGVPASGVSAVVLNTTIASSTATAGYVTAYPTGHNVPFASTINFTRGQVVANRTIVPVGPDGYVAFYNSAGKTPIVLDVTGWFTDSTDPSASGSYFMPLTPTRIVDTRSGIGAARARLGAASLLSVGVAGAHAVPTATVSTPAIAAVATVTLVHPSSPTYATAFPSLTARPLASDLNATAGATVPNLVLPGLGTNGKVLVYNNSGTTDLIVDLSGYFIGSIHIPKSTVVVGKNKVAAVSGSPAGNATVTLAAGVGKHQIGDIIAADVSQATPKGLLVQVVGVSTDANGREVLKTVPATLSDALGSGDFAVSVPFSASDLAANAGGRAANRVLTMAEVAQRQEAHGNTPITQPKQKSPCSGDASSYIETSFSIAPTLNFEAHLGWSGFQPTVQAKAYAQVTEQAFAGLFFQGKVTCSWKRQLAHYTFPTIKFFVGSVPVFITPELTMTLNAGISGQAKISTSVSQTLVAKAGLDYDGSSVKPIQEFRNTLNYQPLSLTQAKASASVAIEAELIGKLYGIAGPTITLTATLGARVDVRAHPWWIVDLRVTAKAGLKLEVSVIHKTAETPEFTLYYKVLAQAGGNPVGNVPVVLTFSEYPLSTTITNAYQSWGIVFSGDPPPYISTDGANPTSPVLSGGAGFGSPLVGTFVNPDGSSRSVSTFTIDVGYIDQPGSTEIVVYSSTGALLSTQRATLLGIDQISVTARDIHSFLIRSTGVETNGWAIDNLRFQGFTGSVQALNSVQRHSAGEQSGSTTTRNP